jgi:hypothetical protein
MFMRKLKNLFGEVAGPAKGGRRKQEGNSMRRSILNAVWLAQIAGAVVCQSAFAQGGTLLFRNFGDGVNAPIYDLNGELLAPLPNYRVALYGGAAPPWSLAPLAYTSMVSPGYFGTAEPITIPDMSLIELEIRMWDSNTGATYEQALNSWKGKVASSGRFAARFPLGDPTKDPPIPAPELLGLKSFTFPVVNPSIKVSAPSIGTNGFTFTVTGPANGPLEIQAATNLTSQTWAPLVTGTLTNGSYTYSEPEWTNNPARFYRVKLW